MNMKRRMIALAIATMLALSVTSCGGSGADEPESKDTPSTSQTTSPSPKESEPEKEPSTSEPEPSESNEEPAAEGAGDLGDSHVEIKGAALAQDYEGKPAIVITYAWTNNSEDTTNAMVSVSEKAFQDGVQMENAIIMGSDIYESGTSMKDVRPGTTIDVQCAFLLTSDTSTVEFELTEFMSFTDNVVTMDFDPTGL